jgi:hypothetical protein
MWVATMLGRTSLSSQEVVLHGAMVEFQVSCNFNYLYVETDLSRNQYMPLDVELPYLPRPEGNGSAVQHSVASAKSVCVFGVGRGRLY